MLSPNAKRLPYGLPPPTVPKEKPRPTQVKEESPAEDETAGQRPQAYKVSLEDELEIQEWIQARGSSGADKGKGKARMEDPIKLEEITVHAELAFLGVPLLPTPACTPCQSTPFKPFSVPLLPANLPALPARTSAATAEQVATTGEGQRSDGRDVTPEAGPSTSQSSPGGKANPLPLDRLFPAGTVVIRRHTFSSDAEIALADDGWTRFSADLLRVARPDEHGEDETLAAPVAVSVPSTPSKKRRRSSVAGARPSPKRAKLSNDPIVDLLVANSASRAIVATARTVGTDVIVRVYLVPQDLPELLASKPRKNPVGTTVLNLLRRVRVAEREWAGELAPNGETTPFLDESDTRSLLEVYRDIESPSHDPAFADHLDAPDHVRERIAGTLADNPVGVSTPLFPYQLATLAKMLARELAPQEVALPTYILRKSRVADQQHEVFVSTDGHVCLEPRSVCEPRGGILAEDMGVGKTLITLALVMSTLSELPDLAGASRFLDGSDPGDPDPLLLTKFSQEFPFAIYVAEERETRPRLPERFQGVDLFAREEQEYEEALRQQQIEDARELDLPFPSLRSLMLHMVKTSPFATRYPHPGELSDSCPLPERLFHDLQATPPFYRLLPSSEQLQSREGRRGALPPQDIIVAATTLIVVPTDLVRQWEAQIREHLEPGALRYLVLRTAKDKFRSAAEMATFDLILMSVARFSDAAEANDTSLRGVHWKRLVIDEGHVLSNGTRMRKLAQELRTESRWAVSGTPSTNLRVMQDDEEAAIFSTPAIAGGDRSDYDRLGQLFSRFLQHDAFPKPDMLRKAIQVHVLDGGERPARLAGIFDHAIIRHRPEHVRSAFTLPPLSKQIVHVEMEQCERRVYNSLLALFVSNAVTSQRVDVDYLFHPSKRAHLDTLTENVASATTFFGSQEFASQIFDARKFAREMLNSHKSLNWTDEERAKEHQVLRILDEVLADPEAILTAGEPSIAFEVFGIPDDLLSTFRGLEAAQSPLGRTLVSASELVRLRVDLNELRHADVKAWNDADDLVEELLTFEQKRKRIDARPKNYKADEDEEPLFKKRGKNAKVELAPLPEVFRGIQLGRTTSAKFHHIIKELKRHPNDKFIIFSSSRIDLLFANLSEALDLLGIRHKIFAGGHAKGGDRGTIVQHFNTTTAAECQAILVDAKLGGRGINLTAASRVIMLEPIWRPDLEVQAEKRAHRLGQTKPVDLQVLVVKSSFEDAMLARRAQLLPEDFAKRAKAPQQDMELRSLLQEARYLEPSGKAEGASLAPSNDWDRVNLFRDSVP
ncbi:hypothetical protein JCM10908_004673 [Rhodotorula pacifica]|uniref:DEAD/DEAH box helicase n=1 Tax=Rhodotorula pacifica TaxID=1495444 RepID=UPI0031773233